jgi:mevalonate kinase
MALTSTASAPGKAILIGEHAVVYGTRSIAIAIDLRCEVTLATAEDADDAEVTLRLASLRTTCRWKLATLQALARQHIVLDGSVVAPHDEPATPCTPALREALRALLPPAVRGDGGEDAVRAAAEAFLFLYVSLCAPRGRPPQRAVADASLPIGAGLGSSAAYSVALVAAMHGWRAHCAREDRAPSAPLDARERAWVNAWAFESERLLHGRPSGVDNAVSAFGGSLAFQEGEVAPLGATPALPLLLVNTRVPRNTKALVAGVRERREALPAAFDHIFGAVHELARSCEALFRSADAADAAACGARLGALVELNHALLRALGVSHAALERVVDVARAHGLRAKLTGAGGGGCALVLLDPAADEEAVGRLRADLEAEGFECLRTVLGAEGARVAVRAE